MPRFSKSCIDLELRWVGLIINNMKKKELHYQIAKIIAESDSIGEGYFGYCEDYTREQFGDEAKEPKYTNYHNVALKILKLLPTGNIL